MFEEFVFEHIRMKVAHCQDAVASHAADFFPLGQAWGLGRDALGLSHLTLGTTGRIFLHLLDLPPFPCEINLCPDSRGVNTRVDSCMHFSISGMRVHAPMRGTNRAILFVAPHFDTIVTRRRRSAGNHSCNALK